MKNNPIEFKYIDCSNNLFAKIQIVNALTKSELGKLNEKYSELGLFIKQVRVDEYGNEISENELLPSDNNVLNKKRKRVLKKSTMTLEEFCNKYYDNNSKKSKKINDNKSISNDSIDDYKCSIEELKDLNKNLIETYNDCQNIDMKKCKIDEKDFPDKIIDYIKKFSKFLSKQQYADLFQKWKNKNFEIKGFNEIDVNNINNWKIPVLKGFKSEMILIASSNVLNKKIREKDNNKEDSDINEEKEEEENEEKKDEESGEKDESLSESEPSLDNYFKANIAPEKPNDDDNDENDNL